MTKRPKLRMSDHQTVVKFGDVREDKRAELIDAILDHLGLEIICEATPDYVAYEVRQEKPSDGS